MNALIDDTNADNTITSYGLGWIKVAGEQISEPCIVTPNSVLRDLLPQDISNLVPNQLQPLIRIKPEVVIFGTGTNQFFLDNEIALAFESLRIGVEYMSTAAACRSFNVLLAEARSVAGVFYMMS